MNVCIAHVTGLVLLNQLIDCSTFTVQKRQMFCHWRKYLCGWKTSILVSKQYRCHGHQLYNKLPVIRQISLDVTKQGLLHEHGGLGVDTLQCSAGSQWEEILTELLSAVVALCTILQ